MKAAAFYEYGPAEAMQYADIPDPGISLDDVLIRVQACGVNPVSYTHLTLPTTERV